MKERQKQRYGGDMHMKGVRDKEKVRTVKETESMNKRMGLGKRCNYILI